MYHLGKERVTTSSGKKRSEEAKKKLDSQPIPVRYSKVAAKTGFTGGKKLYYSCREKKETV